MTSPGNVPMSGLRAVRKVVTPSDTLDMLLKNAWELSHDLDPVPGYLPPLVYASEGLRVALYDRRVKAGEKTNGLIRRMYTRMESPKITVPTQVRHQPSGAMRPSKKTIQNPIPLALKDIESVYLMEGRPLTVRANKIVVSSHIDDSRVGCELALLIDDGDGASLLHAQQKILHEAEKGLSVGRKLLRFSEGESNALEMPFMRAPLLSQVQQNEFIDLLSTDLPVHDIEIGPIEWKPNTVAYVKD